MVVTGPQRKKKEVGGGGRTGDGGKKKKTPPFFHGGGPTEKLSGKAGSRRSTRGGEVSKGRVKGTTNERKKHVWVTQQKGQKQDDRRVGRGGKKSS